jgi:hypothetical protein
MQELENAEIRQNFVNLQQEMEAKRRKFHKLHNRLEASEGGEEGTDDYN